jgi:two-component system, OmpR family, sensor histidine kinase KdpD
MGHSRLKSILRFLACAAGVGGVVGLYRVGVAANPTTVSLTFLLLVLVVSANWRHRYAVFTAVLATISFNFFFLPPVGTFTIADPHNWTALVAFMLTALIGSQLSEQARRSAEMADKGKREAERLHRFSERLLQAKSRAELLRSIPGFLVETFSAPGAALVASSWGAFHSFPGPVPELSAENLQQAAQWGEPIIEARNQACFLPVRGGTNVLGAIGMTGVPLLATTLEGVSRLAGLAIERAQAMEELAGLSAARERERLRSALLDSVAHDLRTPLTAIKASVTGLLGDRTLEPAARDDLLAVIGEETDRLDRLIENATAMARLDARQVRLQLERHPVRAAIDAAVLRCQSALADRRVEVRAVETPLLMDLAQITQVLTQLLDNAAKYSPPGSPIRVVAECDGDWLTIEVNDRGVGIAEAERELVFHEFYRGQQHSSSAGMGMGLAIAKAIVDIHGGTIAVSSTPGRGSTFSFKIPVNATADATSRC